MNGHLQKAKDALDAAKEDTPGGIIYHDLLRVAEIQAQLAQADALHEIVRLLKERTL